MNGFSFMCTETDNSSRMGGLLFLVMSALFRQAAELQEDQDLTI